MVRIYTPEERERLEEYLDEEQLEAILRLHVTTGTSGIERDWKTWLKTVAPSTFTGSFAPFHAHLWDWYWKITHRRKSGKPLADEDLVFLALWFRGAGKSSNVEWACLAEGALLRKGYVLYVSGTQALAEGHVSSIRERLESEELARHYPHLASPKVGAHGNQHGWRQDFLSTAGGWAVRPMGLDVGVRGGRLGEIRPSLIVLDDVDDHGDSPALVQKKLDTIARSVLPAGNKETIVLGAQNLIHRNSVFNQIYTRRSQVLSRRIISSPVPAFENPVIEIQTTRQGPRNILVSGTPTWADIDKVACQKFLDDSGPEAWFAEYQHDFARSEQGRVIPEYDESVHVIGWKSFQRCFGVAHIPAHWRIEVGHDVGFTREHLSAWTWIATSALNSVLPGRRFRYRGRTFSEVSVDDQAAAVIKEMMPDASTNRKHDERTQITRWVMSHEALSERITYRDKYRLPFGPCNPSKTAGVSMWRHYLKCDKNLPHPFKPDVQYEDGTWAIGSPTWFDVVDDDQVQSPRDDHGLMTHRAQTIGWQWRPTPLTDSGFAMAQPTKAEDDTADSTRMIASTWGPAAEALTEDEAIDAEIFATAPDFKPDIIAAGIAEGTRDPSAWDVYHQMARKIRQKNEATEWGSSVQEARWERRRP